jgi:hypothetical protein
MTIDHPTIVTPQISAPTAPAVPAPPSWAWRRGAFLLAGAAQLITISALTRYDPLPATWSALLLAVAPALRAAVAFGPAPANMLGLVAAAVVIIVGGVGQITHTGLFFAPALILLVVAGVMLWRERSSA